VVLENSVACDSDPQSCVACYQLSEINPFQLVQQSLFCELHTARGLMSDSFFCHVRLELFLETTHRGSNRTRAGTITKLATATANTSFRLSKLGHTVTQDAIEPTQILGVYLHTDSNDCRLDQNTVPNVQTVLLIPAPVNIRRCISVTLIHGLNIHARRSPMSGHRPAEVHVGTPCQ